MGGAACPVEFLDDPLHAPARLDGSSSEFEADDVQTPIASHYRNMDRGSPAAHIPRIDPRWPPSVYDALWPLFPDRSWMTRHSEVGNLFWPVKSSWGKSGFCARRRRAGLPKCRLAACRPRRRPDCRAKMVKRQMYGRWEPSVAARPPVTQSAWVAPINSVEPESARYLP